MALKLRSQPLRTASASDDYVRDARICRRRLNGQRASGGEACSSGRTRCSRACSATGRSTTPPEKRRLAEGAARRDGKLKQGANDFGHTTYDGPAAAGPRHLSYHFRLAALDTDHLDVGPKQRPGSSGAWRGHIINSDGTMAPTSDEKRRRQAGV